MTQRSVTDALAQLSAVTSEPDGSSAALFSLPVEKKSKKRSRSATSGRSSGSNCPPPDKKPSFGLPPVDGAPAGLLASPGGPVDVTVASIVPVSPGLASQPASGSLPLHLVSDMGVTASEATPLSSSNLALLSGLQAPPRATVLNWNIAKDTPPLSTHGLDVPTSTLVQCSSTHTLTLSDSLLQSGVSHAPTPVSQGVALNFTADIGHASSSAGHPPPSTIDSNALLNLLINQCGWQVLPLKSDSGKDCDTSFTVVSAPSPTTAVTTPVTVTNTSVVRTFDPLMTSTMSASNVNNNVSVPIVPHVNNNVSVPIVSNTGPMSNVNVTTPLPHVINMVSNANSQVDVTMSSQRSIVNQTANVNVPLNSFVNTVPFGQLGIPPYSNVVTPAMHLNANVPLVTKGPSVHGAYFLPGYNNAPGGTFSVPLNSVHLNNNVPMLVPQSQFNQPLNWQQPGTPQTFPPVTSGLQQVSHPQPPPTSIDDRLSHASPMVRNYVTTQTPRPGDHPDLLSPDSRSTASSHHSVVSQRSVERSPQGQPFTVPQSTVVAPDSRSRAPSLGSRASLVKKNDPCKIISHEFYDICKAGNIPEGNIITPPNNVKVGSGLRFDDDGELIYDDPDDLEVDPDDSVSSISAIKHKKSDNPIARYQGFEDSLHTGFARAGPKPPKAIFPSIRTQAAWFHIRGLSMSNRKFPKADQICRDYAGPMAPAFSGPQLPINLPISKSVRDADANYKAGMNEFGAPAHIISQLFDELEVTVSRPLARALEDPAKPGL